jgi:hypothetical protein
MMIAKEANVFERNVRDEGAKLLTEMEGFN